MKKRMILFAMCVVLVFTVTACVSPSGDISTESIPETTENTEILDSSNGLDVEMPGDDETEITNYRVDIYNDDGDTVKTYSSVFSVVIHGNGVVTLKMDKDGKETHEFVNVIMEITQTKVTIPKENKEKDIETEVK